MYTKAENVFSLIGILTCGLVLFAACQTEAETASQDTATQAFADDVARIEEVFETPRDEADNVDSPAVWHGPDGQHWLLATAKEGDVIRVHDAATGEPIERIGGEGTEPGQMDRPNGVATVEDLMLVVERNNRRVQVFRLPEGEPLGAFGQDVLRLPYGLTVYEDGGEYVLYVTDAYEAPD